MAVIPPPTSPRSPWAPRMRRSGRTSRLVATTAVHPSMFWRSTRISPTRSVPSGSTIRVTWWRKSRVSSSRRTTTRHDDARRRLRVPGRAPRRAAARRPVVRRRRAPRDRAAMTFLLTRTGGALLDVDLLLDAADTLVGGVPATLGLLIGMRLALDEPALGRALLARFERQAADARDAAAEVFEENIRGLVAVLLELATVEGPRARRFFQRRRLR